jgi:hypothetical protein
MTSASDEVEVRSETAQARYELLVADRQPFLNRARDASRLTIPSLIPPEGSSGSTQLYRPYQSTGADGVNNLAAKLLMALFPPGTPFFRLTVDDFLVDEAQQQAGMPDPRATFETALGKIERSVVNRMEQKGSRKVNFEAIQHLIVAGNGLLFVDKKGGEKFFPLTQYVVARDLDDNVLEIVVKECIAEEALPDNVRAIYDMQEVEPVGEDDAAKRSTDREEVEVFTWIQRTKKGWTVHQEVCDKIVPGTQGTYPKEKSAWIPLRWTKVSGAAYGRGRCEEYIGDLYSLESATAAIIDFAAAASKVLAMVDEAGVTSKQDVARARSGDVVDGRAKDVTFLMLDKSQDFQVARAVAEDTKSRLERAFLMASSIQRQAERVTAEEIRVMAGELEQGLGGVYSILSEEFQKPLVTRILAAMMADPKSRLPKLPDGTVSPQIVTGLDGLGRNTDMQRLDALIQGTAEQFGPQAVAQYVNVGAYMERRAAALGIDIGGLVRSDAEIQQQQQQAQMQSMAEKLGGPAINAVSQNAIANKNIAAQQAQSDAAAPPAPAQQ